MPRLLGYSRPLRTGRQNRNAADATPHCATGLGPVGYDKVRLIVIRENTAPKGQLRERG